MLGYDSLFTEEPGFASPLQCLRPPAIQRSEIDVVIADVILEFSQIPVGSDVRNHEVIGTDDVSALYPALISCSES